MSWICLKRNCLRKEGDKVARIRTIEKAYDEIRRTDPDTCISKHFIKNLVIDGEIPYRKTGNRYLIDLDNLINYVKGEIRE